MDPGFTRGAWALCAVKRPSTGHRSSTATAMTLLRSARLSPSPRAKGTDASASNLANRHRHVNDKTGRDACRRSSGRWRSTEPPRHPEHRRLAFARPWRRDHRQLGWGYRRSVHCAFSGEPESDFVDRARQHLPTQGWVPERARRTRFYLTASTSIGLMSGSAARRSEPTSWSAAGIWPFTCASRPSSLSKVSKMP